MELFYLPIMSERSAEPAARRGTRTRDDSLKLPDLAVQTPRDSQIGVVAELSPGCSCSNYTSHSGIYLILLHRINRYILYNIIIKFL
jgi:hypothetical protein